LEHGQRGRVLQQREQQVLDGHELVACLACLLVALADRVLEILAEHFSLRQVSPVMGTDPSDFKAEPRLFPCCTTVDAGAYAKTRSLGSLSIQPLPSCIRRRRLFRECAREA